MLRWAVGLIVALGLGHVAAYYLVWTLRCRLGDPAHPGGVGIPAWLTGLIERLFFGVAVGFDVSGVSVAMIAWLGAKMAASWNRAQGAEAVPFGFSALLGGLVSMFFALLGGLISSGTLAPGL